ncbi:hypothetical protein [Antarctobacter sp.]|uniref:hypothetical protein n=1 Tax=Antarctobacter sp. TaxID=1872577 RepID=UPI002B26B21B|nr:hypothetical protein [Antarctobacter sp.]
MSAPEDYRVKNAREGKAVYIPGRPIEEFKAELERKADMADRKSLRLHLDVSLNELEGARKATDNAATNYSAAADAFDLLAYCIGQGAIAADDEALGSTLYLLGQGMRSLAETQGNDLSQFGLTLGRAAREGFDFIPRN